MSPDRRDRRPDGRPDPSEDGFDDVDEGAVGDDVELDDGAFDDGGFDDGAFDDGNPGGRPRDRSGRGDPGADVRGAGATDDWGNPTRSRRTLRRPALGGRGRDLLIVAAVLLVAVAVGVGGSLLPVQLPRTEVAAAPLVGRTSAVCPVAEQSGAEAKDKPDATVTAVAIRQAPGREGLLTGTDLQGDKQVLEVKQQGFGTQAAAPRTPLLLQGTGIMSTASSGAVLATAESGELAGLSAAPCSQPSTSQWFVGVGAESANRTELVLSNPDDSQAEVDLRFFGRTGRIVVPGSPGLVVPAHESRTVSLESLVDETGPLTVWVRATSGRVSAMARDLRSVGLDPAGVDWHPASVGPRRTLVVPGVPQGAGARELQLVNPSTTRATVGISVLGASGAFVPVGAEQVEVPPESTVTVSLADGLAGQGAGIELSSDLPVSASVVSTSSRTVPGSTAAALPDIAVQPATVALGRNGVSPIASVSGTDGTLMMSNSGDTDTTVRFTIANLNGVTIREDTMLIPAHGTSTRRLDGAAGPSYVVVSVPEGAQIYGAVDFAQPDGEIAGLTSLPITSPDVAARSREAVADPAVGR